MSAVVKKLIAQYHTRDPFELAQCLGFILIKAPLAGVRGFYQYIKRNHIIYVDDSLSEKDAKFVCAHELGHALLHKDINRIFLDTKTLTISNKYEIQANRFAIDLLYSDEELLEFLDCPIPDIARSLGVSESLVEYRFRAIKPD